MPDEYDLILKIERPWGEGKVGLHFGMDGDMRSLMLGNMVRQNATTITCEIRRSGELRTLRLLREGIPVNVTEKSRPSEGSWPVLEDGVVAITDYPDTESAIYFDAIELVPVSSPPEPAVTRTDTSCDQFIAERILWRGGAIDAELDSGAVRRLKRMQDIPEEDFEIVGLDLHPPMVLTGATSLLNGIDELKSLSLRGQESLAEAELMQLIQLTSDHSTQDGPISVIESLDLSFTEVSDGGLALLASLPKLKTLRLKGTGIGDAGMQYIANLPQLETLELSGTKVSDAGIRFLAGLTSLRHLDLDHLALSDDAIGHLREMRQLSSLSLCYTKISDESIVLLKDPEGLRELSLVGAEITREDVTEFESALPGVVIEHSCNDTVDLLERVDVTPTWHDRGLNRSECAWQKHDNRLVGPYVAGHTEVGLSFQPPPEYVLETVFTCDRQGSKWVTVPWKSDCAMLKIDSMPMKVERGGIMYIDGCNQMYGDNGNEGTVLGRVIQAGDPLPIRVTVRSERITMTCGDRLVVDWAGDPTRLQDVIDTTDPTAKNFRLGTFRSRCEVTRLELTPLSRN